MNKFELFTMIFYALDLYYEENPTDELGEFLGAMSPFTFKEVDSADSAIYSDFCEKIKEPKIAVEKSRDMAIVYLKSIDYIDLLSPFMNISESDWISGCNDYLTRPHKGQLAAPVPVTMKK